MVKHALIITLCLITAAEANALRCQNGLVAPGDHEVEVLSACGEPAFREEVVDIPFRVERGPGIAGVSYLPFGVVFEEWVYDFGPQRFRQLLRFRNHRLIAIETLSKPR